MPEESKSNKVVPGGLGCQGCGCAVVLLFIIGSFVAGVVYNKEAKSKYDEVLHQFADGVREKVDVIKDKVE